MIAKCNCNNCSIHIEFDSSQAGSVVTCPNCQLETRLFIPPTEAVPEQTLTPQPAVSPRPKTGPKWFIGLIIMGVAVGLFFTGGVLANLRVRFAFVPSAAAVLFMVYGLAYLIVCLAARKSARKAIRLWKFQTNLASLISTVCVLAFIFWSWAMVRSENSESAWGSGSQYIHKSDKQTAEIFETVESVIKGRLVSPSSAKFETIASIIYDERNDDIATVRIEVDSQNKYGAMIHTKWQVGVRRFKLEHGELWQRTSLKMIATSEK